MTTPPPETCPACGSDQIEFVAGALFHGFDKKGRMTDGRFRFGTCKSCSGHFEQSSTLNRDTMEQEYHCSLLTDEQWQREVDFWSGNRKHGT